VTIDLLLDPDRRSLGGPSERRYEVRAVLFSARPYDVRSFRSENASRATPVDLAFQEAHLDRSTVDLARGYEAVVPFVNDVVDADVIASLAAGGTRLLALRSAGFNHVDLEAAESAGITVMRVPAYSPHAVAEFTVGLMLAVDRRIHRAYARVRDGNFNLEGLLGSDLRGRTVGIVGSGRIGVLVARILHGFGCELLVTDPYPSRELEALGARVVDLGTLLASSDIITLHCPLTPETHHLIDAEAVASTRPGVMIVNTSRGALVDTRAVIDGLKSGHIGTLALDVYEEEGDLFFEDLSDRVITDDVFSRLLTFPNVLITAHQAFFTTEALARIASTTLDNIAAFASGVPSGTEVVAEEVVSR
jgi:D-lactate dehydrogenase